MTVTPRILVAEDEIHLRRLISSVLESAGYDVEVASDGMEAWERLGREPRVDLLLTDLRMPNMDGLELLRRVSSMSLARRPATVVLTAVGQTLDHAKALQLGAGQVMTKPFSSLEILEAVKQRLAAAGSPNPEN